MGDLVHAVTAVEEVLLDQVAKQQKIILELVKLGQYQTDFAHGIAEKVESLESCLGVVRFLLSQHTKAIEGLVE